jgi:hypothetical protein
LTQRLVRIGPEMREQAARENSAELSRLRQELETQRDAHAQELSRVKSEAHDKLLSAKIQSQGMGVWRVEQ